MNDSGYLREAAALDREILRCIQRRTVPDFDDLALRVFAHQLRYNVPYARYCAALGVTLESMPAGWEAIPPAPADAYKEQALCTFDAARAELIFQTSGTTGGTGGMHYMENAALYDAALLAGFADAMLADRAEPLTYLLLLASPQERPRSSLGYMMARVADRYGDGGEGWYVRGDVLDVDHFIADAQRAATSAAGVCIAGTAFAFVQLLDALAERDIRLPLPAQSRIMETGGFKGRTRVVERDELYANLCAAFALPAERIVAEYGMTELTSQYYDRISATGRIKKAPPWLRARVVDASGATVPPGTAGTLVHVDLANRSSCVAVQTQDVGVAAGGGFVLIGRERSAQLRGCSLDAEQLRALERA